jgi:hypothetical protein
MHDRRPFPVMTTTLRAAVLAALFATAAFASAPKVTLDPAGPYRGGEPVQVRWSGLPDDVLELEFLLVRDGRVDDVVRMTPQLDPNRGQFVWRVPRLGADGATLVLRAGNEEEENELAVSDPFSIAPAGAAAALSFRDGEWWEGDAAGPLVPGETRFHSPYRRVHARKSMDISRVRGRMPGSIAVSASEGIHRIAPAESPARWNAAPLTIPQRK